MLNVKVSLYSANQDPKLCHLANGPRPDFALTHLINYLYFAPGKPPGNPLRSYYERLKIIRPNFQKPKSERTKFQNAEKLIKPKILPENGCE